LNLASLLAVAAAGVSPWTPPAALSSCPAGPAAYVVFPSDSPSHATGPGAVVWSASPGCPGGAGARVAAIGADDLPGESTIPRTSGGRPLAPQGTLVASGAPHGQIAIGGGSPLAPADGLVIQGSAAGPFAPLAPAEGLTAPMALASAYLGDLALAAPAPTRPTGAGSTPGASPMNSGPTPPAGAGGLRVHVERFFARGFAPGAPASAGSGRGPVQTVALAMDYRSEALVAWAQGGAVYARLISAHGAAHPVQRLAAVGPSPRITALLSDDLRGIVAWADQRDGETSVYIDRSATGVRFGAPELLERFVDPDGLPSPAASPTLVRLSSESVMLAWAGSAGGHWVVRTAPIEASGMGEVSTIAAPETDALLAGLAPGPADDALLLWTEPMPASSTQGDGGERPDMARQALLAARGADAYPPARTAFGEPELVAPPAQIGDATGAFDPDSDRPIVVWRGQAGTIEYSLGA
jgi:hypothetical protein